MYKILFVCTGATCRSPMACAIFNKKVRDYSLSGLKSSFCGVNVVWGSQINEKSKIALHKFGVGRVCGVPSQITGKHLADYNLVICMTEEQKQTLHVMVADKYIEKILCIKDFCGYDICDPYGQSQQVYDKCLHEIDNALEKVLGVLLGNGIAKRKKNKSI